jgi:hypothetical protein
MNQENDESVKSRQTRLLGSLGVISPICAATRRCCDYCYRSRARLVRTLLQRFVDYRRCSIHFLSSLSFSIQEFTSSKVSNSPICVHVRGLFTRANRTEIRSDPLRRCRSYNIFDRFLLCTLFLAMFLTRARARTCVCVCVCVWFLPKVSSALSQKQRRQV